LKIHFAILYDGKNLESWQSRCLEQLLAVADVRAALLIDAHGRADGLVPLPDKMTGLPTVSLIEGPASDRHTVSAAAIKNILDRDLDFVLCYCAEACPPELFEAARHGVWAFQLGDWTRYRGVPSGFWEVYDAEPVTAARLVRLQRDVDSVIVLREAYLRTDLLSHGRNLDQILARITRWPAQMCIDLRNGVTDRLTSRPLTSKARVRRPPTRAQLLGYRCKIILRTAGVLLRSLFRHDQWNVGRLDRPISSFLHPVPMGPIQWLKTPSRFEFRADPFGTWRDGRLTILYEHFSYRNNRGTIAAIDPGNDASGAPVQIGPQPAVHLSYPYLIEVEGRLLCVPESHEAAEIGLYAIERFPDRWVKIANLLQGIPIVDATIFRHEGTWWLAGSEPTAKGTTCELHLWHAPAITGPWYPHATNPVKTDIRSARPGGTPFHVDGVLYRPAQDCSRTYGGRVVINRVVTLTPTAFHETPAATVEPDPAGPYPAGLHTLSRVGDITLIDAKRAIFSPPEFRRVLMHFLRSAGRRAQLKFVRAPFSSSS
jgi:hypothetical protein